MNIAESVAEMRNKYSPANYVPTILRRKNENISRSKSINDIGLPTTIESKVINDNNYCVFDNNRFILSNNTNNEIMFFNDDDDNKEGNNNKEGDGNNEIIAKEDRERNVINKQNGIVVKKIVCDKEGNLKKEENKKTIADGNKTKVLNGVTKKIQKNINKENETNGETNLDAPKQNGYESKTTNKKQTNTVKTANETTDDDNNNNRQSVLEIRKKFDNENNYKKAKNSTFVIQGVKISDNPFKKEDTNEKTTTTKPKKANNDNEKQTKKQENNNKPQTNVKLTFVRVNKQNPNEIEKCDTDKKKYDKNNKTDKKSKLKVNKKEEKTISNGTEDLGRRRINNNSTESFLENGHDSSSTNLSGGNNSDVESKKSSRTNNFASYISAKDFDKGDSECGEEVECREEENMEKNSGTKRCGNIYRPGVSFFFRFFFI